MVRQYFWRNDSFLTLKSVCSLVEDQEGAGISALVLLHPGPVLEAVASGLAHHLGLPLLVVDYIAPSTHLTLNFAPSALSVGRALADLLAAEQLAGPIVFYTDYRQLAVFDALLAAGGLKAGGSGAARLVKVETEGLWVMERRPAGEGTAAAGVLVLLSCRRADGLAFLEAALLAGWLGRGSRVVLPCLDLRPPDIVKYEGVGAVIYLAYLDVPGDRQGGLQGDLQGGLQGGLRGGLTGHLMEDILTGQACFSVRQCCTLRLL